MALHLARRRQRFTTNPSLIRFFSNSSSDPFSKDFTASGEKPSKSPSSSSEFSYSSPFTDIKATLEKKLQKQQEQGRNPSARSNAQSQNRGTSKFSDHKSPLSLHDLGKKLANYERRPTFSPSRDSQSRPQISFETVYKQSVVPKSADPRNRIGQYKNSNKLFEKSSFKNTLNTISDKNVSWNGLKEDVAEEMKNEFLSFYSVDELGEKLKILRPEGNKEEGWFSLQELNERLVKLRQVEVKAAQNRPGKLTAYYDAIGIFKNEKDKYKEQNNDLLGLMGSTPEYKHYPPKEELVETYFHTDNLSSAEKMKIELTKVKDEFKMSESDCGSARVQVAQLTTKIKHLSSALHKKDKHSRKGLLGMVQKRKKLLKYLRRTDWDSYCLVLSKLSLRDNPDYKC
ncbi:unnamed protein product [Cochlearia groenlandica]